VWSEILLLICSCTAILLLFLKSGSGYLRIKLLCTGSFLAVIVSFIAQHIVAYESLIIEWTKISGISFFLIVVAITIRELKPEYARYPVFFSYLPLGIIAVYPFITDADVLKNLLNQMLQGGGLVVSLLLYFSFYGKLKNYGMYMGGIVLFIIAYAIYWFADAFSLLYPWAWQLPLAIGFIMASIVGSEIILFLKNQNRL